MWGYGMGRGRGFGRRWNIGPPLEWRGQLPSIPPPRPGITRIVASTDNDKGLEAPISFRFARAPYLTIIDIEKKSVVNIQAISNTLATGMRGVGVGVGQWIISIGAKGVLAPHLGPNIQMVLNQANITTYIVPPGIRVMNALRKIGLIQ